MGSRIPERLRVWGTPVGLLLLRVVFGLFLALNHGWPKLATFAEKAETFPDPLGVGGPVSLALAIFGELVCAGLVVIGLATRIAAIPAALTMLVAALVIHADSRFGDGEHALLFAGAFIAIACLGPGPISLDALLPRRHPPSIFRNA